MTYWRACVTTNWNSISQTIIWRHCITAPTLKLFLMLLVNINWKFVMNVPEHRVYFKSNALNFFWRCYPFWLSIVSQRPIISKHFITKLYLLISGMVTPEIHSPYALILSESDSKQMLSLTLGSQASDKQPFIFTLALY